MIARNILLTWLGAATALGSTIPPGEKAPLEDRAISPRKYPNAITVMAFPINGCSSNGVFTSFEDNTCIRPAPRIQSIVVRNVISGCRGE